MRLLILGGSFNPLHIGHLILAEEARFALGYTHVVLIPAAIRPGKEIESDPGPEARVEMVRSAVQDDPSFLVWDGEIRRGGSSYSIDSVRELSRSFDLEGIPGFLLGDDLLPSFRLWKEADSLAREVRLICAHRERSERLPFMYDHEYLDNLLIPVSSRLVRERIARGQPYRRLLPDPVWRIIEERGYYRHG